MMKFARTPQPKAKESPKKRPPKKKGDISPEGQRGKTEKVDTAPLKKALQERFQKLKEDTKQRKE